MRRILSATFVAALLAATALLPATKPADAAVINMCQSQSAGTAPGPARWTARGSGTSYTLNNRGCALINVTDVPEAVSAGFTQQTGIFVAAVKGITAANSQIVLPAGTYIDRIVVQETSGASITGGLKFGTSSGGTQIVSAAICGASCLVWVPDASISTRIFSTQTQVFIDAVSSWNSAAANVTIFYGYY